MHLIILVIVCISGDIFSSDNIVNKNIESFSKKELKEVASKIFLNETGGNQEYLVWWNPTEPFPSLGIGHFIWFPKDHKSIYVETFPSLVQLYRSKNIKLPRIMDEYEDAPWNTYAEFTNAKYKISKKEIKNLEIFLYKTRDIQLEHIYQRLKDGLPKMLKSTKNKAHVEQQFNRVLNSKGGLYPLIDYINFKGEGTKETEKYNNQGFGLLQVLEDMQGIETGQSALDEFSESAKKILLRRIYNAKNFHDKDETIWTDNWIKRCDSYKQ
ncbi:MAG: hypothetical protein ACRCTJ_05305 [Brevinema sp.]